LSQLEPNFAEMSNDVCEAFYKKFSFLLDVAKTLSPWAILWFGCGAIVIMIDGSWIKL
jgi:hypothetical protein